MNFNLLNSQQQVKMDSPSIVYYLRELMQDIANVDVNLSIERLPEKVLLLLGETKAGKTTLMYYLLNKKLILEISEIGVYQMRPQAQFLNAIIGNNYDSATVYPNIPTTTSENDVLIIDMPGFNDTRQHYRLLNIYILRETIKKIKSVHISIVIPYESLSGVELMNSLQKSCLLLKDQFIVKEKSLSFILTKIEDNTNKQTFEEQIKMLEEEYPNGKMSNVMKIFNNANIYLFENKQPIPEEGENLRKAIISQNKFYDINQVPQNLLSSKYSQILVGKSNSEQFLMILDKMLDLINFSLPKLIKLQSLMYQYHYKNLFIGLLPNVLNFEEIQVQLLNLLPTLSISNICLCDFTPGQVYNRMEDDALKNMLKKYVRSQMQIQEEEKGQDVFGGKLHHFINISHEFIQDQSVFTKQLREIISFTLKYIPPVLKTVQQIKNDKIASKLRMILNSSQVQTEINDFYLFAQESDLAQKLIAIKQIKQLAAQDQHFKSMLLKLNKQLTFGQSSQKIEYVPTYNVICNKNFYAHIQQTKKIMQKQKSKIKLDISVPKIQQPKNKLNQYQQICNLQMTPQNFGIIIIKINQLLEKKQSSSLAKEQLRNLNKLFEFVIQYLQKISLIEESLVFTLALPNYLLAEKLIKIGIQTQKITSQFVKQILVPYYSRVNIDFSLVQLLFNFLLKSTYDRNEMIENQKLFAATLTNMHTLMEQQNREQINRRRYDINLIAQFLTESGTNYLLEMIIKQQKTIEISGAAQVRTQIQKLKNI